MSVWLIETGASAAHLYPDDDAIETAACGHVMRHRCGECGQVLMIDGGERQTEIKCSACKVASASEGGR